ncbi:NUDIX domain-containing protein [Aeromicrobium fastidiosum]|uniref:NUDIX domain-containing protein n=1 Tax=Aeromicrobium fastidiosum TaxID=52699 RepID=A0A641AMU5_9ACTN|nr:NUDIX hydrolase [Aeromicrobium fastidiosum]KAA1378600.1 NUDIX domain-containing protein [Aeromicrobium fastidiosum]MBP2392423.1 ADP-ribose pyrophosphatase YjhB (NUDIX family) [Aeromicrobium fastidiosum]
MDADGWTHCSLGHRHWGLVGAAGLLVVHDGPDGRRFLLQHRSVDVHHGDTWALPGGALGHDESAEDGALREATEELADLPAGLVHLTTFVDDHGGWAYSTVVVRSPRLFAADDHGWETGPEGFAWLTADEIAAVPLHAGFAATWPAVLETIA